MNRSVAALYKIAQAIEKSEGTAVVDRLFNHVMLEDYMARYRTQVSSHWPDLNYKIEKYRSANVPVEKWFCDEPTVRGALIRRLREGLILHSLKDNAVKESLSLINKTTNILLDHIVPVDMPNTEVLPVSTSGELAPLDSTYAEEASDEDTSDGDDFNSPRSPPTNEDTRGGGDQLPPAQPLSTDGSPPADQEPRSAERELPVKQAPQSSDPTPYAAQEGEQEPPAEQVGEPKPYAAQEGEQEPPAEQEGEPKPYAAQEDEQEPPAEQAGEPGPYAAQEGEQEPPAEQVGEPKPYAAQEPQVDEPKPYAAQEDEQEPPVEQAGEPGPYAAQEGEQSVQPDEPVEKADAGVGKHDDGLSDEWDSSESDSEEGLWTIPKETSADKALDSDSDVSSEDELGLDRVPASELAASDADAPDAAAQNPEDPADESSEDESVHGDVAAPATPPTQYTENHRRRFCQEFCAEYAGASGDDTATDTSGEEEFDEDESEEESDGGETASQLNVLSSTKMRVQASHHMMTSASLI